MSLQTVYLYAENQKNTFLAFIMCISPLYGLKGHNVYILPGRQYSG